MAKNIENDSILDCWSCVHSQSGIDRITQKPNLSCALLECKAPIVRCDAFVYEPGTDQGERDGI